LLARDNVSLVRGEHGNERNLRLVAAQHIPRDPNAVGLPELRWVGVLDELFGPENKLSIRLAHFLRTLRVVVGIDHEGAIDGDRVTFLVVEIQSAAEAPG
jgi:hypothetical protein